MKAHWKEIKDDEFHKNLLKEYLKDLITDKFSKGKYKSITIFCIGTDRSTGDVLGPLVGEYLKELKIKNVKVIGNLEDPAHAKNLEEKLYEVESNSLIIAVDACLGSLQNVGQVIISDKPMAPGAAMNKDLPLVGEISITGSVNISGAFEFMVLQNTRLYETMGLAKVITMIIKETLLDMKPKRKKRVKAKVEMEV